LKFFTTTLPFNEREIINSILQGEKERNKGEEYLFNRYAYFIKEAVIKYSISYEDAFDLYSDSVISAIEKIRSHSFEERSSLKTWLHSIFHHKYVDFIRRKTTNKNSVHRFQNISDAIMQFSDESKTIIQQLITNTDYEMLKKKLLELGNNCQELLLLWANEYSDNEIVSFMSYKTANVVKTTRLRCLQKLRELYKGMN